MSRIVLLILLLVPCAISANCPPNQQVKCETDPCKDVWSPYCEANTCGMCRPICFVKKGGQRLPCYFKECPTNLPVPSCFSRPCGLVTNKNCKPTCASCSPICFGANGQQVPCKYKS